MGSVHAVDKGSSTYFYFDPVVLRARAQELRASYMSADPFPHIVIDDFLPPEVLEPILEEFPGPKDIKWETFKNPAEVKLASNQEPLLGPCTRHLLAQFNSQTMCEFLETLTGISGIIPDPWFWGGGLHQIQPGGFLKIHADFNKHKTLGIDRRLNLLLYLNKDWKEEYGGHLELWDKQMQHCVKRVLPVFNRVVVFSTNDDSYHGHPVPLTCPPDRCRRSMALYYYTQGRPAEEVSQDHTTLFKERPGEHFELVKTATRVVKKLVPPIVLDAARLLRGKEQ